MTPKSFLDQVSFFLYLGGLAESSPSSSSSGSAIAGGVLGDFSSVGEAGDEDGELLVDSKAVGECGITVTSEASEWAMDLFFLSVLGILKRVEDVRSESLRGRGAGEPGRGGSKSLSLCLKTMFPKDERPVAEETKTLERRRFRGE